MANTVDGGVYLDASGNYHDAQGKPVKGDALAEYTKQAAKREDEAKRAADFEQAQRNASQTTLAQLLMPQQAPVAAGKPESPFIGQGAQGKPSKA